MWTSPAARTQQITANDAILTPGLKRVFAASFHGRAARGLLAQIEPPFVPRAHQLRERCERSFTSGHGARWHWSTPHAARGHRRLGGLDSTLALIVLCKTLDQIGAPEIGRENHARLRNDWRTLTNAKAARCGLSGSASARSISDRLSGRMKAPVTPFYPAGRPRRGRIDGELRSPPPPTRLDVQNVQARPHER